MIRFQNPKISNNNIPVWNTNPVPWIIIIIIIP